MNTCLQRGIAYHPKYGISLGRFAIASENLAADASTSIANERGGDFDLEGWEDLITARHFGLSNSLAAFKNDIVATS
jgi:hypothetical protein